MKRLCLLFCFINLQATAGEDHCDLASGHPLLRATHWYGLYYQDMKIGHAVTTTDQEIADGTISHDFEMTFKLEQVEETITQVRQFEATPPHRMIGGSYQTADRRIDYTAAGNDLHLSENGSLRVWEGVTHTLCDEEDIAVYHFLDTKPDLGAEIVTVDFDVEHQALLEARHRVEAVSTRRILGADHVFHTLLSVSNNDVFSYNATSQYRNGEGINFFLGPMELRVETEAIAREPNIGVDLFAEFEKPLNSPLVNLDEIEELTLRVRVSDIAVTIQDVIGDSFLQRVDYLDDKTAIVTLGDFEAPDDDSDVSAFLRPTSAHPSDHARVHALAEEIRARVHDPASDQELAEALLHFVAGYIENVPESPYAYNTTSVFDILDNRTGDCTEHSQLFITLARSMGLPARDATGYVYGGDDDAPSLGGHAWVEVYLDGRWVGLDPTWEELDLNLSHVQTKNDFVLGLSFEVLDIVYRS